MISTPPSKFIPIRPRMKTTSKQQQNTIITDHEVFSELEAVKPLVVMSNFAHSVAQHVTENVTLLLKMETIALANNAAVNG